MKSIKLFDSLKVRYKEWRDQRFLKREGFTTWEAYHRWYDPDVQQRANTLKEFYKGFNYIVVFENYDHHAYKVIVDYGPGGIFYGTHDIIAWCKEHCTDKFRQDCRRMYQSNQQWNNNEWILNEIGGDDYFTFAFKSEQDAMWFKLKWGV